jgi:hypothetical protein
VLFLDRNQVSAERLLLVKVYAEVTKPNKAKSEIRLDPLGG